MITKSEHIILFDGMCNLCSGIVKFLIRKDKKQIFKFASLQSETGKTFLKSINISPDRRDTFVYIRRGNVFIKSLAGIYVLKDLGGIWKLFFIFKYLPSFLRDPFYNIVSKFRYKIWGRKDYCMVPDKDILSRFLD